MEPTIKDKYIILGFIGVAICLISFFITLIVSASFNQDNFVRLIVFVCSNILGWLLYLSFQTVIFDSYEIWRRLTREITNIPLRHFVWNISERFMYKKYYNGDNRANFIKTLFPREFADTDIATIKNFKVDPSKTLIPIDEPENGSLDFHYPEDYAREVNS